MAQTAPAQHSPPDAPRRPKGILKNSSSFYKSPDARISPSAGSPPSFAPLDVAHSDSASARPGLPHRELSEKEITQMNTEINMGDAMQRRNSSNPRSSLGRRQSSQSDGHANADGAEFDESGTRLKWDEANLYLNEGQMGGKMKIDEPKTPFAKQYDPAEDEEELANINAQDIAVDELEMDRARKRTTGRARTSEIPGLDLGEPELPPAAESAHVRRESSGERRVHVDSDYMDVDGARHGEDDNANPENMTSEEREKHRKFEQMRRKHYEMRNIKDLLGHPDKVDEMDDDE